MKSLTLQNFMLGLLVLGMIAFVFSKTVQPVSATGPLVTNIGFIATTTSATAITTSARILSTTTSPTAPGGSYNRLYTSICNANTNPVVLNLDADKPANQTTGAMTTIIAAAAGYNACYEINDRNQYNGSITASSTNQTSTTITVKDYVI